MFGTLPRCEDCLMDSYASMYDRAGPKQRVEGQQCHGALSSLDKCILKLKRTKSTQMGPALNNATHNHFDHLNYVAFNLTRCFKGSELPPSSYDIMS